MCVRCPPRRRPRRAFSSRLKSPKRPRGPRAACPDPTCNLTYHGGALVLGPHTTHVVYWEPPVLPVTANYHSLIQRFLTDVAADSGRATNVYATDTQYDDSTNTFIQYQQTFAGALTDTNAFPATQSGCPTTDGTLTVPTCLTQTEEAAYRAGQLHPGEQPPARAGPPLLPDASRQRRDLRRRLLRLRERPQHLAALLRLPQLVQHQRARAHPLGERAVHRLRLGPRQQRDPTSARPNGDVTDHELNVISHEHNENDHRPDGGRLVRHQRRRRERRQVQLQLRHAGSPTTASATTTS